MTSRLELHTAWGLALASALALAAAWLATTRPALAVLAPAAILVAVLIYRRPESGALAILVLVILLPRSILFDRGIPFGGGSLKVTDVLLALTLGSWLMQTVVARRPLRLPASGAVTLLLLTFICIALIGVATARSRGTPQKIALLELRPLLSYLLVFPLVDRARTIRGTERFLHFVLVALAAASGIAIWRYTQGQGTGASYADNAIRVIGWSVFSLLGLVWSLVLLPYAQSRRARVFLAGLAALSLGGEFVSFQRTTWVATIVALALAVLIVRAGRRRKLVGWMSTLLIGGLLLVLAVNTLSARRVESPVSATVARFHSILAYRNDVSAGRRINEWNEASKVIEANPLGGIGLGGTITFIDPEYSPESNSYGFSTTQNYIHNSYIWLALKLGIPGLVTFLLLVAVVARNAGRAYRARADPRLTPLLLGALLSLAVFVVESVGGPAFNDDNTTPVVAAVIALLVAAPRLARDPAVMESS